MFGGVALASGAGCVVASGGAGATAGTAGTAGAGAASPGAGAFAGAAKRRWQNQAIIVVVAAPIAPSEESSAA